MQCGGDITRNQVLRRISSIGFELESGQVSPAYIDENRHIIPISTEWQLPTETTDIDFVQSYDTMTMGILTKLLRFNQELHTLDKLINLGDGYNIVNNAHGKYQDDTQYLDHTEFIMTFKLPPISDNIILTHFYYMLQQTKQLLYQPHVIRRLKPDIKVMDYGLNKPAYIVAANTDNILDTKWVPQCTIRLNVSDVPIVIDYIAVGNYKQRVTEHYQRLLQDVPNPSDLDRGYTYLGAMFLTNSLKTSPLTIRHSWRDIAMNWDNYRLLREQALHNDIIFHDVRQFPLEEHMVMIELRTFKPQLEQLIDVKSLTINNMLHGIENHFGGNVPDVDHPVIGQKLMIDRLLESD